MNLLYGKIFKPIRKSLRYTLSSLYPIIRPFYKLPTIKSIEETIDEIQTKNYSLVRFGDGEIIYLLDKYDLAFQKYNIKLSETYKDILLNRTDGLLVGLPDGFKGVKKFKNQKNKNFWRSFFIWSYPRLIKYLNFQSIYYNSNISRIYYLERDAERSEKLFKKVKNIWYNRKVILVEGEKSRAGVGNDLFLNTKSVSRILGPAHEAFEKSDDIIEEIKKIDNNDVIVLVALGPTAKYVVFNIHKLGYQAIDIGNLDIEYEWFLRRADAKIKIEGKYTSEAIGGRIVEDIKDEKYDSEIIAKIL